MRVTAFPAALDADGGNAEAHREVGVGAGRDGRYGEAERPAGGDRSRDDRRRFGLRAVGGTQADRVDRHAQRRRRARGRLPPCVLGAERVGENLLHAAIERSERFR